MSETRGRKQPIDFRKEEVTYVMQRWRAGDSCSLIGVGSVGKSNLLQHLADPAVQAVYMELTSTDNFKAIMIDPNLLGPLPKGDGNESEQFRCWAGYELMMHRLVSAFHQLDGVDQAESQRFIEIYHAMQDGTNPLYAYLGLRYLELALDFFARRDVRLVFMFDEFEDFLRVMPVKFFQSLRGLRDLNKQNLSFLAFTRAPLNVLIERNEIDELEFESFLELFTDGIHYVGPYNDTDARRMVQILMDRNNKQLPESMGEFLLRVTGHYAGLLRATFRLLDTVDSSETDEESDDAVTARLVKRRAIKQECRTIWLSLTPMEQQVLRAVAGHSYSSYEVNQDSEQGVALLVQKRLLRVETLEYKLFIEPPLFRAFMQTDPAEID